MSDFSKNATVAFVIDTDTKSGGGVVVGGGGVTPSYVPPTPGAPAPSITACLAFAGVLLLQALRRKPVAA